MGCGALIGLLNGFFGGGGGMICVPLLENVFKLDNKVAHATTIAVILPLSLASSFVYFFKNNINHVQLLYICAGVVAGGILGALLLKKLSGKIVRLIFAIIMLAAGIRMVI